MREPPRVKVRGSISDGADPLAAMLPFAVLLAPVGAAAGWSPSRRVLQSP